MTSWEDDMYVEHRREQARRRSNARHKPRSLFGGFGIIILWIFWALSIAFAVMVVSIQGHFASETNARKALTNAGYTHVQLIDRDNYWAGFKGCGDQDVALFTFRALNPRNDEVTVHVCEGWPFKGATIRY